MQIVIDIPEETYKSIKHGMRFKDDVETIMTQIENGTPLPKGHGRLIDAEALKKDAILCPTVGNSETLLLDIWNVEHAPTIIEADKEEQK